MTARDERGAAERSVTGARGRRSWATPGPPVSGELWTATVSCGQHHCRLSRPAWRRSRPHNRLIGFHTAETTSPSLVRGTRRTEGHPRIVKDTDRAAHRPYEQVAGPASCRLQRRGHRFKPCHAHQLNPQANVSSWRPDGLCNQSVTRRGRAGAAGDHRPPPLADHIASSRSRSDRSASGNKCPYRSRVKLTEA